MYSNHMLPQGKFGCIFLFTDFANNLHIAFANFSVVLVGSFGRVRFVAVITHIWMVFSMCIILMVLEMLPSGERFATMMATEWFCR